MSAATLLVEALGCFQNRGYDVSITQAWWGNQEKAWTHVVDDGERFLVTVERITEQEDGA